MSSLESTRTGWAIVAYGVAAFAVAMAASYLPTPWGYIIGMGLGTIAGSVIVLGLLERRNALEYRREMRAIDKTYGRNR